MEGDIKRIRPQDGYQIKFLSTPADIAIGGAAAGVGKTYSLLMEPLRHKGVKDFESVIFRRTSPQIRAAGGLWDTSTGIYSFVGAAPRESTLEWRFEKAKLKFSHLEHEKNVYDWQGAQITLIGFDELTHFTRKQFFYLMTRNRSVCGVKPYIRATTNPDPDSWVAELISWWIDPDTGFPIPERDGVLRYLILDGENYIWGDSYEEVIEKAWYMLEPQVTKSGIDPKEFVKSVTFISGSIYDNKELLRVNPSYLANLMSQDAATKAALLEGNWKFVQDDDDIYDYPSFIGCFENNITVTNGKRYISADIALEGSDKFVIGVWDGFELIDIVIMDKSNGPEVINAIKGLCKKYSVPNKHVVFDNNGVGGFVKGFINGALPFLNNGRPLKGENYFNLKTQCYYKSGERVNKGGYKISEEVANRMYDDKMTVRQRFIAERKAIKRDKKDNDGKLRIIDKAKMKVFLNGESPDMMDMFMMREYFELIPKGTKLYSG